MAQDALDRWWWPSLMMFGPPDGESVHSAQSAQWKIKLLSNDELRQRFVDQTVPQADYLGIEDARSRPASGTRSAATTTSAPIDWAEFHEVLKGNGPCNKERLAARVEAWDNGAWVRDAAVAHAQKQRARRRMKEATSMSKNGRCGKSSSARSTGSRTSTSAACTRPTPRWRCKNARDVYTRRNEGVSIWVVESSDIAASSPGDARRAVRARERRRSIGIRRSSRCPMK